MLYNSRPVKDVRFYLLCPCITIAKEAILFETKRLIVHRETVIRSELYCNEVELALMIMYFDLTVAEYSVVVECVLLLLNFPR